MKAFHNQPAIKELYVQRVKAHAEADEIIQGVYWEHGKGCAVGCTIHGNQLSRYETELGIPRILAHLQDRIFEGLPSEEARDFPVAFLEAIPVGADLSLVPARFMLWLLADEKQGLIKFAGVKGQKLLAQVADLYRQMVRGEQVTSDEWKELSIDYAHYYSEYYAAYYGHDDHYDDEDNYIGEEFDDDEYYVPDGSEYDDTGVVTYYAVDYATNFAAYYAYDDDREEARRERYGAMRDKLLELLAEAPVAEA